MPKFNSECIPEGVKKMYLDKTYKEAIGGKTKQVEKWRRLLQRMIKAWKEDFPKGRDYLKDNSIKKLWWKVEYLSNQQFAMEQEYKKFKVDKKADMVEDI